MEGFSNDEIRELHGWPGYFVAKSGKVFSSKRSGTWGSCRSDWPIVEMRPTVRKGGKQGRGYAQVGLHRGTERVVAYVHRLVLETFVGESLDGRKECNHKNGLRSDNRLENLEWVSRTENVRHGDALKGGRPGGRRPMPHRRGENGTTTKLTIEQVRSIRAEAAGGSTHELLGKRYGVSSSNVTMIVNNKTWCISDAYPKEG